MKRKTKEQREAEQRAALRQRIADIATGAAGYEFDNGDEFATADFLARFVPALRVQFGFDEKREELKKFNHLWSLINLQNYNDVDSTTDFFFDHGVRA